MSFYLVCVYILTGLLGLCVGSFLNVVIYRLPKEMSLVVPPSHCTSCGYRLKWYDNIPLVSYFLVGGRCRRCRERISFRYVTIELLNMLLWLLSVLCFWGESSVKAVTAAVICSCFICIFCIDIEHMLIFNRCTTELAEALKHEYMRRNELLPEQQDDEEPASYNAYYYGYSEKAGGGSSGSVEATKLRKN